MSNYELWYCDALGNRLEYIAGVQSFRYVKVLGDVGALAINLPYGDYLFNSPEPDRRVHIYRQATGGKLELELIAFLRRFEIGTTERGQYTFRGTGYDQNELLLRRIVAYYAGSDEAQSVSEAADDAMKNIIRFTLDSNSDYSGTPSPSRDIGDYGYSREGSISAGPTITKAYAWRIALNVLQDLQAASRAAGTEVFFGYIPQTATTAVFRTWTQTSNRTASGTNLIIFSLELGNLLNPSLDYDYTQEANVIYAGGQGQEDARIIATAKDTDRAAASPINLRETFVFSSGKTSATVTAEANAELERRRPRRNVSGTLLSTPSTPYGGDGWRLGDKVTVAYAGLQFDVLIRSVMVEVRPDGKEVISSRIERV